MPLSSTRRTTGTRCRSIQACEAGKDVYVEKPLSLFVTEGRAMVDGRAPAPASRAGRHSPPVVGVRHEAAELVRGGGDRQSHRGARVPHPERVAEGHRRAAGRASPRRASIGTPGSDRRRSGPYNKNRTFYRFRWFYDYSGGQLTNFGVHYMDAIHWALGHDAPLAVTAMGGKVALDDNREIPDTLEVLWTYPGGTLVTFSQYNTTAAPAAKRQPCEIEFRGTKGTLYLFSDGYEIVPDEITPNEFPARTPVDRAHRARLPHRRASRMIEPAKSRPATTEHRATTPATSSIASGAAPPASATSKPATGARRPRSSATSRTGRVRTSSGTAPPSASRTTRRRMRFLRYRYRAPYEAP